MLPELLHYLIEPCPEHIKKMGYLHELIAIKYKAKRLESQWAAHLTRSKQTLLGVASLVPKRENVVVLGSGLLLDVPLDEFSLLFNQVILIDIYHNQEILKKISRYPNIVALSYDLTGTSESLWLQYNDGKHLKKLPKPIDDYNFSGEQPFQPSLIVSLNLLSQLSYVPWLFLRKFKRSSCTQQALIKWKESFFEAHITALSRFDCHKCLITDHESICRDKQGKIISRCSTFFNHSNTYEQKEDVFLQILKKKSWRLFDTWEWEINPMGERSKEITELLKVGVFLQ